MKKSKKTDIINEKVSKVLVQLTLPMILGILGLVAFNLADTYFIGKLGTLQLAALSFTFPIVLIFGSINQGIGIGASVVISKAVGMQNHDDVKRHVTDSLLLGIVVSIVIVSIGLLTIEPLFSLLGADGSVMPIIKGYMSIWYLGAPFVVIPMIGNNAIRALGDTKTPGIVMLVAALGNIILDPILIFGVGAIAGMGVQGAALATVFSRFITFCVAVYVLVFREKVVSFKNIRINDILQSWKNILFVGLPNALAKSILPLGNSIITGLIATLGNTVVAGFGIATRVEFFFLAVLNALASITPIYVGQNFGAGKISRIKEGVAKAKNFSLLYGAGIYAILFFLARPLASIFTDSPDVMDVVVTYLRIIPLGYGFFGLLNILNGAYNALQKPIKASTMNVLQVFAFYVPLATIAIKFWGDAGIFASAAVSYIIVGLIFWFWWKNDIEKVMTHV